MNAFSAGTPVRLARTAQFRDLVTTVLYEGPWSGAVFVAIPPEYEYYSNASGLPNEYLADVRFIDHLTVPDADDNVAEVE